MMTSSFFTKMFAEILEKLNKFQIFTVVNRGQKAQAM